MQAILSAIFFVKMKNHLPNLYVFSAALILIISLGLVGLASSEFYNVAVLQETDSYPFGSEGPVAGDWKYQSKENDLIERILNDDSLKLDKTKFMEMLDPKNFIGFAPIQTEEFIQNEVQPILDKYSDLIGLESDLKV